MINTHKTTILLAMVLLITTTATALTRVTGCANGILMPKPGTTWMWQLSTLPSNSAIDNTNAQVIDIDMFTAPASLIDYIHSKGKAVFCYIDTQYEPDRPDSAQFVKSVLGSAIEGWPGQKWVDIRSPIVWNIMINRAKMALNKGCDGIEWDDVDGYANTNGLKLKQADQLAFNKFLANLTHGLGMSVGLKNDLDQVVDLVNYFDWALNEQCYAIGECDSLKPFIQQNKAVFGTEYSDDTENPAPSPSDFCPTQNAARYSWLDSTLDLNGKGVTQCCTYASPACQPVNWTCATPNPAGYPYIVPANVAHASSENLPGTASGLSFSFALLGCLLLGVLMM